jgi:hypothetical protein
MDLLLTGDSMGQSDEQSCEGPHRNVNLRSRFPFFPFFFFWWGLLHGPQQGPDRMKEKNLLRLGKGKLLPKTEKPSLKNHSLRNWPTLARAQAKSVSEEQTEKGLTL